MVSVRTWKIFIHGETKKGKETFRDAKKSQ